MDAWWHRDVTAAGKLPLALCFLAFVVTFLVTRLITRSIRDGKGPFHDNVDSGGTHIHHSIPGLILLIVGAFIAVGSSDSLGWRCAAGIMVGIGVSLVLDEFALILHLQDVYWSGEGALSVQLVSLTAACLGLVILGFSPWGVEDPDGAELAVRWSASAVALVELGLVIVCVLKGKYRTALFGIFLAPVAAAGAIRLARPNSKWARDRYGEHTMQRATRRAADFDKRFEPILTKWDDLVGGTPSLPDPPPATK